MKQLLQLTLFQLKDKIDMSWMKSKKTLIQSIVFGVLKFAIVSRRLTVIYDVLNGYHHLEFILFNL